MTRSWVSALLVAWPALGCGSGDDVAFDSPGVGLDTTEVRVREGSGVVSISVSLTSPAIRALSADYSLESVEAQNHCQMPDFSAARGRIEWRPGEQSATLELFVGDDALAELDERFDVVFEAAPGSDDLRSSRVPVVIEDDDRTALVEANDLGVLSDSPADQSGALQAALVEAEASGRGVVRLRPGTYVVSSVSVPAGTTLTGRGARLVRPPMSGPDVILLDVPFAGERDSEPTLLEGLTLDGARDAQGPFRALELEEAHLLRWNGAPALPGRLRGALEGLSFEAGTGNGVSFGPNSDATLCSVRGSDLWRDFVSLRGGNSRLRMRDLDASAEEGTSGMWFDGLPRGYGETRFIDVEIDDVRLGSGDVELEAFDGSRIAIHKATMTQAPFRVVAPNGSVRISDSVLRLGVPSERYNFFATPHDVLVENSTLVASERIDDTDTEVEAEHVFSIATVRFQTLAQGSSEGASDPAPDEIAPGPHRLLLDRCHFALGSDVEANDRVFAAANTSDSVDLEVRGGTLGPGVIDWFEPGCVNCTHTP